MATAQRDTSTTAMTTDVDVDDDDDDDNDDTSSTTSDEGDNRRGLDGSFVDKREANGRRREWRGGE